MGDVGCGMEGVRETTWGVMWWDGGGERDDMRSDEGGKSEGM